MAETRSILWRFLGDSKSLEKASSRSQKSMGTLTKAAGTLGVALGAGQLVRGIGSAISRAEEMDSKYEITKQILEQTGYAAGLTAEDIEEMSSVMSKATGLDKAIVTDAANVLLTFKDVKDEAGEMNDVFSRGLVLTGDMATVFGGSAKDAAKQLGKALNDPLEGMTALSRVGVQFTDEQKEQIRVLQESGDLLGAQKIVLGELESQVGGTAEASADASEKIKRVGDEMMEAFGKPLLDVLVDASDALEDTGDSAEGMAGQAGDAVVRLGAYETALGTLGLMSDDTATTLDKLKGGVNVVSEVFTGGITDLMGWGEALKFDIETAGQLEERLGLLAEEGQDWRDAAWAAQEPTEDLGDDLDDLAEDAGDAEGRLKSLKELVAIFSGDLFNLGDAVHAANVEKLFAGGAGSGQTADPTPNVVTPHPGIGGPTMASGGVVPGRIGTPQAIIAHGGERISGMGSNGGGTVVNINVTGFVGSEDALAQAVADAMTQYEATNGTRRSGVA